MVPDGWLGKGVHSVIIERSQLNRLEELPLPTAFITSCVHLTGP